MEKSIVTYKASDGSDVRLSPGIVAKYVITGGLPVDEREVYGFMAKCQARHLNPLAGDAYMTTYRNKATGKVEASVIVSKDYFVRTATQQPGYDGIKAGIVVWDRRAGQFAYREGTIYSKSQELLVGGWAEVYDKSRSHPSRAEVSLEEYDQHRSLWKTKPATMIRKVALVQALREAYPGAYGGLYDRDEMPEPPEPVAAQVAEVERESQAMTPGPQHEAADHQAAPQQAEPEAAPEPEYEEPAQPEVADEDYEF